MFSQKYNLPQPTAERQRNWKLFRPLAEKYSFHQFWILTGTTSWFQQKKTLSNIVSICYSCTHKKISDQEERKKTCIYNAYNWLRPLHIWIYENKTMQYFTADGVHNDVARGMQNEGIYIVNIYFKQKWSVYY